MSTPGAEGMSAVATLDGMAVENHTVFAGVPGSQMDFYFSASLGVHSAAWLEPVSRTVGEWLSGDSITDALVSSSYPGMQRSRAITIYPLSVKAISCSRLIASIGYILRMRLESSHCMVWRATTPKLSTLVPGG